MVEFVKTCRHCFREQGISVQLYKKGQKWVCPRNPNHQFSEEEFQSL
ncbi:MAG: hypothetical protein QW097_00500 [archaeon]